MGRLIDVSELHNTVMLNKSEWGIFATPIDRLVESLVMQVSTADAIPKADYENRLKADLKAILVELQLEIEELDVSDVVPEYQNGAEETKEHIANMIEEKINSLKEDT